jgi:hypothetical protein
VTSKSSMNAAYNPVPTRDPLSPDSENNPTPRVPAGNSGANAALQAIDLAGQVASEVLEGVQNGVSQATKRASSRLARGYQITIDTASRVANEGRQRLQHVIEHYPLQFVGCVAGAAFLTGVIVRISRSSGRE